MKPGILISLVLLLVVGGGAAWYLTNPSASKGSAAPGVSKASSEGPVPAPEAVLDAPDATNRAQGERTSKANEASRENAQRVVSNAKIAEIEASSPFPQPVPPPGDTTSVATFDSEAAGAPFADKYKDASYNARAAARDQLEDVLRGITNDPASSKLGEREITELKNELEWLQTHLMP